MLVPSSDLTHSTRTHLAKETSQSLKRQNRASLAGILIGNFAAFVAVLGVAGFGIRMQPSDWIRDILPAGVATLVVSLLNSQLSPTAKARIVYARWSNPLPGARAFSRYAQSDARVDIAALTRKFGPFPTGPREQNALWYKMYRSVEDKVEVRDANQQFLLWRDCTTLLVLLFVTLVPIAAILTRRLIPVAGLAAFQALQFGLAMQAARVNGERLVSNVLALKGAEGTTTE